MEPIRSQENYFGALQVQDCDQNVPINTRMGEAEISQVELGITLPPQNPEKHD